MREGRRIEKVLCGCEGLPSDMPCCGNSYGGMSSAFETHSLPESSTESRKTYTVSLLLLSSFNVGVLHFKWGTSQDRGSILARATDL